MCAYPYPECLHHEIRANILFYSVTDQQRLDQYLNPVDAQGILNELRTDFSLTFIKAIPYSECE